jgi:hypothetical protein
MGVERCNGFFTYYLVVTRGLRGGGGKGSAMERKAEEGN